MTPDRKESISVIIPAFNSARYIGEAIKSVLGQTLSPYEIIVIDDGSTDETESIVKKFDGNIRYEYQQNHGPSHARNSGIQIANGDYLAFIDADDVWVPESLSVHMDQFKLYKNLDISVGLTCMMRYENARDVDMVDARENASLHLSLCATVIKKTIFDDTGLFDEDLLLGQDTDWFLKAKEKEKSIAVSRELVSLYRRHSNNRTNNKKMVNYYFFMVFKKAKDRRVNSDKALNSIIKKPENQDELIAIWHNARLKN